MGSWLRRALLPVLLASAPLLVAAPAAAGEVPFGPHDIPTTFFISKSDDHNRVDYGMRLDAGCAPVNDDAVFGYWREFEKPPVRTHGFSLIDHVPYGIAEQRTLRRTPTGAEYLLRLKQLARPIVITTTREADGRCSSVARTAINGADALLQSVFVKLAGFASVEYIDVLGKHPTTGAPVTERVKR
jgi:hypothetical protein